MASGRVTDQDYAGLSPEVRELLRLEGAADFLEGRTSARVVVQGEAEVTLRGDEPEIFGLNPKARSRKV